MVGSRKVPRRSVQEFGDQKQLSHRPHQSFSKWQGPHGTFLATSESFGKKGKLSQHTAGTCMNLKSWSWQEMCSL